MSSAGAKNQAKNEIMMTVYTDYCYSLTDLVDGDFGALSDLSEGELSVVCGTSESHLEREETSK